MPAVELQGDRQSAVMSAYITEVHALKPGNVSRFADGHDMTVADFERSAELVSPVLCDRSLTVGERILESVRLTMSEVGCNTNLGMLLLFAPLIRAAETATDTSPASLHPALEKALQELDVNEAKRFFEAIRRAAPGGLGHSEQYDVHLDPACSVLTAMNVARKRDFIAKQYVTGFSDIFSTGLPCIKEFNKRWNHVEWAAVGCYLKFLSSFPDSHVLRKHGQAVAHQTRKKAQSVAEAFKKNDNPVDARQALLEFDKELKNSGINPGTSADLTAASVLVYELTTE